MRMDNNSEVEQGACEQCDKPMLKIPWFRRFCSNHCRSGWHNAKVKAAAKKPVDNHATV